MPFGGPPPINSKEWPFAVLLKHAMENGLGLEAKGTATKWTAKLLSLGQSDTGASPFSYQTVESWVQARNVPQSPNWELLLDLLTDEEPERYREAWRRELSYAHDIAESFSAAENRERVKKFEASISEDGVQGTSVRALLRRLGAEAEKKEQQELIRLENAAAKLGETLNFRLPKAVELSRSAEEARKSGQYALAEKSLGEASTLLLEEVEQAVHLRRGYATVKGQLGSLYLDRDLFVEAASAFLDALRHVPLEDLETRQSYIVLFLRATREAALRAIDYLEAKSLLDSALMIGLRPDVVLFATVMHKAEDYEQAKIVYDALRKQKVKPNRVIFNILIEKTHEQSLGIRIYQEMLGAGILPDIWTFNQLLKTADSSDAVSNIRLKAMEQGLVLDRVSYNTLITKAKDLDEAKTVFREMIEAKVNPGIWASNNLLGKAGNFEEAKSAFSLIDQVLPTIHPQIYSGLLSKAETFEEARGIIVDMYAKGVELTPLVFVNLASKVISSDQIAAALELIRSLKIDVTRHLAAALLAKQKTFGDALDFLSALSEFEQKPDAHLFGVLWMKANGDKERDVVRRIMDASNVQLTPRFFGELISEAVSTSEAINLIDEMVENGIPVTSDCASRLIGKVEDLELGLEVIKRLEQLGIALTSHQFAVLLSKARSVSQGISLLALMREQGKALSAHAASVLIGRSDSGDEAKQVLDMLQELNVRPSAHAVSVVIAKTRSVEEGLQILDRMKSSSLPVTPDSYSRLISKCSNERDADKLLGRMRADGFAPSPQVYAELAGQAAHLIDGLKVVDQMIRSGHAPTVHIYSKVIPKASSINEAKAAIEHMNNVGIKANAHFYTELVRKASTSEEALSIAELAEDYGIMPTNHLYFGVLNHSQSFDEALTVAKHMLSRDLMPDEKFISSFARRVTSSTELESFLSFLRDQEVSVSSNAMSAAIANMGSISSAIGSLSDTDKKDHHELDRLLSGVVSNVSNCSDLREVLMDFQKRDFVPGVACWNSYLWLVNNFGEAKRVFELMMDKHVDPIGTTFLHLSRCASNINEATWVADKMAERSLKPSKMISRELEKCGYIG